MYFQRLTLNKQILARERIPPYRKDVLATGKGTVIFLLILYYAPLIFFSFRSLEAEISQEKESYWKSKRRGKRGRK